MDSVAQRIEEVSDLLEEVGDRNHLTVVKFSAGGQKDELESKPLVLVPSLHLMDRARMLGGKNPIYLAEAFKRLGGDVVGVFPNLRTNVGIDYVAAQLGGSASATVAKYIALSNNTNNADATNTATNTTNTKICWGTAQASDAAASTSRGEYTGVGLTRAAASYAHTTGVTSYTQTVTFTASGAVTAVRCAGLLDNASQNAGTLFLESTFTSTTMVTNDQLTIAWTVNI